MPIACGDPEIDGLPVLLNHLCQIAVTEGEVIKEYVHARTIRICPPPLLVPRVKADVVE